MRNLGNSIPLNFFFLKKNLKKGNAYVKEEFKLHRKANEHQYKEFLNQWFSYLFELLNNQK